MAMPRYYVESLSAGEDAWLELTLCWNKTRLDVIFHRSPSKGAETCLENIFLDRFRTRWEDDDAEPPDMLEDDAMRAAVEAGRYLFNEVAPRPGRFQRQTLHELLHQHTFCFAFSTIRGKGKITRDEERERKAAKEEAFELFVGEDCTLREYLSTEIEVIEPVNYYSRACSVDVGGTRMFAKAGESYYHAAAQKREFRSLWRLTTSPHASEMRVPKLLGLVKDSDSGRIVGFLEEYIPASEDGGLVRLSGIEEMEAIDIQRRRKWAEQVEETLRLVHAVGVSWGRGEGENVLIHGGTDDAWCVNFAAWGEGYVERDDLAVRGIRRYLQVD